MKNLNQEILNYVEAKGRAPSCWSASTISTVYHKLLSVVAIGLDDPAKVFRTLQKEGYSLYTIKNYFILARSFEAETKKTSLFKTWFLSNRRQFRNCYKQKNVTLTEEKFGEALLKAPSADLFNFLVLMGKGGLRKQEAFDAKWSHIQDGRLEVPSGKGGKQRFIPFSAEWLKKCSEAAFILPRNFVYWKFFKEELSPFTPHDFRSYYATKIVNIPGMSIQDAKELLGHENIETTARYLRTNQVKQSKLILEHFK